MSQQKEGGGLVLVEVEREEAQNKLRESDEWYRSIYENSIDAILLTATDGKIFAANPEACRILQRTEEEICRIGRNEIVDLTDPRLPSALQERARTGKFKGELNLKRKDGSIFPAEVSTNVFKAKEDLEATSMIIRDITERKRTEVAVKESEERFRKAFSLSPDACYISTWDGVNVEVNEAFVKIFGYTREECAGKSSLELNLYAHGPPDRARMLNELRSKGSFNDLEFEGRRKNGEIFPVLFSASALKLGDQQLIMGVIRDLTERKRMEDEVKRYSDHLEELVEERSQELSLAKEQLEHVIESNPAVVYVGKPLQDSPDFYLTFVSKRITSLTGFEPKHFMGVEGPAFWASRVQPDDLEKYLKEMSKFWKDGYRVCEYRFRHKNGTIHWLQEESTVIRDPVVGVREVIGYMTDITERKLAEKEFEDSKKRLESIVSTNPAVIYSGKPLPDLSDWRLDYVSGRVVGMTGFEQCDLVDNPGFWNSRIHPDDLCSYLAQVPHLFRNGHFSCDYRFRCKDGIYRWIREEVSSICDVEGKPVEVVGCWTNITEVKEMEERLAEAEHLAGIGEAAAMVGHDLRNPLQGIAGATYLLQNQSVPAKERKQLIQLIDRCVEYSDGIVNDLLDYVRPLALVKAESTPKKLVINALEAAHVPRNIMVKNRTRDQPTIKVELERVKRVLVNLIENAVDAMPTGGTLTFSSKESNGFMELIVADTGTGMPKEILQNFGKPLQTTKAKGMGYGLAIAKRIVDAHNGEIVVKSKQGEGTIVNLRLPIKTKEFNSEAQCNRR